MIPMIRAFKLIDFEKKLKSLLISWRMHQIMGVLAVDKTVDIIPGWC